MKKKIVTSYQNLSDSIKEKVKEKYPYGYQDSMIRIDKGPNDFFYAIMLETEEVSYLIKIDVKVDNKLVDDKDYFIDEIKGEDEVAEEDEDE